MDFELFGYQFGFGRRMACTTSFKWFYCPLMYPKKYGFVFFWWFGFHTFVFLRKVDFQS